MYCLYRLDVIIPGVTIKTESPNVDNMTTSMEDTEPFDDTATDVPAVKTSRQDSVGVTWDKPPKDENIDGVCKFLSHVTVLAFGIVDIVSIAKLIIYNCNTASQYMNMMH